MKNCFIWILVTTSILFMSCDDENDDPITGTFKDGLVVVNQGPFGSGTATLTFKQRGNSEVVQDVFSGANDGAFLGNIAQSMIEIGDKNFISINNGGKVVVVDKESFALIDTIGDISNSRYFATNDNQLYMSSWGPNGIDGGVYELDIETNEVKEFISIGGGPEGLTFANNQLYIANSGGFLLDSLVLILNPDDNAIIKTLAVGHNPQLMVSDNNDNVYVICSGFNDWMDPSNNTPGALVKISNREIEWSKEIPNGSNNLTIDLENEFLYYASEGRVVKLDINNHTAEPTVVSNTFAYALGFDQEENQLYIADAKDFSSLGEALIYSVNDELINSFPTGLIPGYFHFQ